MNHSISTKTKVEIYSTALCPYCMRAKKLLDQKGIEYIEYRVDIDRALRDEMVQRSQRTSVPQIFIEDKHVGGYDDISELDFDDELDPLLGLG